MLLSRPSIAYVECGSFENANTLKTWFDNKYVGLSGLRRGCKLTFRPATSKIDVRQQLKQVLHKAIHSVRSPKVCFSPDTVDYSIV